LGDANTSVAKLRTNFRAHDAGRAARELLRDELQRVLSAHRSSVSWYANFDEFSALLSFLASSSLLLLPATV
jgi:hypothetical protein